jgi:hypothetical protein
MIMAKVEYYDGNASHVTLKGAAREKGVTSNAVFLWMKYHDIDRIMIGKTIMVARKDLEAYNPRPKETVLV